MDPLVVGVLAWIAAQLALGVWVARRVATESDYLLAGRSLGPALATFSLFATWFGAETCLGAAGATYADGLAGGRADPFGYALCLLLMGLVYAAALRRTGAFTLADVFRTRFSRTAEVLVVLFLVPASILWGAAQIRALGEVLAATANLPVPVTVATAAAVVIGYTMMGGLKADVVTDLVQGIALLVGLALLAVVVVREVGGPAAAWTLASARPLTLGVPGASPWAALEGWLVPIVGSITAQEMAARVLAARTPAVARRSALSASALYLAAGLVPVGLGLIGAALLPGLEAPEQILPRLARAHLPLVGAIVLIGALVAAILSTVDSNLLSASALGVHNLARPWTRGAGEGRRIALARLGVGACGAIATALALARESVHALVEEASAFGGGGMAVAMTFGLLGRFGGAASAVAAMVASLAVQLGGSYVLRVEAPLTASVAVALVVYVGTALIERRAAARAAA